MGLFGKDNKLSVPAAMISAVGIAGTVLWQKKDWVKCVASLHKNPAGWVLMSREPRVKFGDGELRLAATASGFLGRQMES